MKYLFSMLTGILVIVSIAAAGIYLVDFAQKRFYPELEKDTSITILVLSSLFILALAGYCSGMITRVISKSGFIYTLLPIIICGFVLFAYWTIIMKDTERVEPLSILILVVIVTIVVGLFGKFGWSKVRRKQEKKLFRR